MTDKHGATSLVVLGLLLVAGCESEPRYKGLDTRVLLNEVSTAMAVCLHEDGTLFAQIPAEAQGPNAINSYLTHVLISRKYLSVSVLRDRGNLIAHDGDQDWLADAWGRPLIFHVVDLFPTGLTYSTASGETAILPLPSTRWPSERGAVQVWSLGPNGLDDRGEGDDILP